MNPLEMRASLGLAGIYALRMLGMFLILPVFSLYAVTLPGGDNPMWIGLALGSYGLTQALLQLPLGMLSDRIGRKKVIYGGLLLFALGSFIAAIATDLVWLTVGRVVQGSGAVSAVVTALLADLTREENRTKAMAMIGMTIGITFAVSLVLGPLMAKLVGVPGIFVLTGVLTLTALLGVRFFIPDPPLSSFHSDAEANPASLPTILRHGQLLRLNFGIFALHAAQMAMFVVIPFALTETAGLDKAHHWQVYLPVVVVGFLLMIPAIIYGEKRGKLKPVFVGAIALMALTQLGLVFSLHTFWQLTFLLGAYFVAFNILEASLPSLVSKIAPADAKGTAMGVYNTAQSLGLFLGAVVGGWCYGQGGAVWVFVFCCTMMSAWLLVALSMRTPPPVKTKMFHINEGWQGDAAQLSSRLRAVSGVQEAVVIAAEHVAYLKVSQSGWDEAGVQQLIKETY